MPARVVTANPAFQPVDPDVYPDEEAHMPIAPRLSTLTEDGNLDLEDVLYALQEARADGSFSAAEQAEVRAALAPFMDQLEPSARTFVEDALAGKAVLIPRRVLLAPVPSGGSPDLYQPRSEVIALQDVLTALGHAGDSDGLYGPGTRARVTSFQATAGLPQTGVVDTATLLALNERLTARGIEPLDLAPRARIRPDQVVALRGGTNTANNRSLQEALARLGAWWGDSTMTVPPDGTFGTSTESAVKAFQRRAYLYPSGIVDQTTLGALDAALRAHGLAPTGVDPNAVAGGVGKVELHFYPGDRERKVYVIRDGVVLDRYGMVGGHAEGKDDPRNPTVDYSPSPKGTYTVVRVSPHASYSWAYSYVPYGAALRDVAGEVQFRDLDGTWRYATGPQSVFAGRNPPPLARASYLDAKGALLESWMLNDFGHIRAQLQSVRTGQIQTHMIHSSPHQEGTANYFRDTRALTEAGAALDVLQVSHGCEHIHPRDLDELIARGYLAPGTTFVVHGYEEERT